MWTQNLCAYAGVFDGASITNYVNGAVIQSAANTRDVGAASIIDIGRYLTTTGVVGGYLTGDVGRLLFYQGAHSLSQVKSTTYWLRKYYGF